MSQDKEVQSEDQDLSQFKDWLDVMRSLWSQLDSLILENGIFYQRYDEGTSKSPRLQAVVPCIE